MSELSSSQLKGSLEQELLELTIGQAFDQTVARYQDNLAIVVKQQNIRWSYSQYQCEINKLATGMLALGIKPGDRVGIWAPNRIEWCLTQFATAKIGAIMVCINPAYRGYELEYALNKVECKLIICAQSFKNSNYTEMLQNLAPELALSQGAESEINGFKVPAPLVSKKLPHLQWAVTMADADADADADRSAWLDFSVLAQLGSEPELAMLDDLAGQLKPNDAINIQFTSGTTGKPKGATLSHHNILNNGKIVGDGMLLSELDRVCIPVPLYHCFGMVMGNLACITHGSAAIFPAESFEPKATLQTVEDESCTALHGVPTMFIALLDEPDFSNYSLISLRTGIMAGAPCPAEIMKKVIGVMHMSDVLIAYGQTELSPVNHMTAINDPIEKRVNSVGKPGPRLEVKICDNNNAVVGIGIKGEICTRGYSVMQGYWGEPERSAETIDAEGWLHSGDLGIMDKGGYVQVVGRLKDMIIRGGENIYPREVEEFLYTHPAIQDVQVFGVPDKKFGEQVAAWVQLKAGQQLPEEELINYCKDNITHFKIPRYLRFVNEFPMTVTGKIQKFKMREIMIKEMV